jgi:hypothetical protein
MLIGRLRIRRLVKDGIPISDDRVPEIFSRASEKLRFNGTVRIIETPSIDAPLTAGIFKPVILLPNTLAGTRSDSELFALGLHELSHAKRREPLTLTLVSLVRAFFFLHPLVWVGAHRTAQLAEDACDDMVVETSGEPLGYARMLARIAESLSARAYGTELSAGFIISKSAFLRRVEAILSNRADRLRRLTRPALAAIVGASMLSLILALVLPLGAADTSKANKMTISGTVVYKGKPVAGAEIWLVQMNRDNGVLPSNARKARTTRNGSFSFRMEGMKQGEKPSNQYVVAVHPGHAVGWETLPRDTEPGALTVSLDEPDSLSGTVVDEKGKPLRDAEVWVSSISMSEGFWIAGFEGSIGLDASLPALSARTNANGGFTLHSIPMNMSIQIRARAEGYSTGFQRDIQSGADSVSFSLERAGSIAGRVVFGDSRKAVSNIMVSAYSPSGGMKSGSGYSATDARGHYEIGNLPAGVYKMILTPGNRYADWAPSYRDTINVTEGKVTKGVDFIFGKGGLVAGKVTDRETGAPLIQAIVYLNRGGFAYTGTDGSFRIRTAPGSVKVYSTPPSGYLGELNERTVAVSDGGTVAVDFQYSRGLDLKGTVRTADGKPVVGAILSSGFEYSGPAKTDSTGRFLLRGFKEGIQVQLSAIQRYSHLWATTSVEMKPGASVDMIAAPLELTGVSGRVRDNKGNPAPGVEIMLSIPSSDQMGTWMSSRVGFTDHDGKFRIGNLIVGNTYMIDVRGIQVSTGQFTAKKDLPPFEITIAKALSWIEGTVTDSSGKPVSGARIVTSSGPSGYRETNTDAKGRYRLDGLVGSMERISIVESKLGIFSFEYVLSGRTRDFVLDTGDRFLAGTIADPLGKPLSGIYLSIEEGGPHERTIQAETDENGKFRFDTLKGKTVTVNAHWSLGTPGNEGWKSFEKVETNRSDASFVIDLAPPKAGESAAPIPPRISAPYPIVREPGKIPVTVDGDLSDWTALKAPIEKLTIMPGRGAQATTPNSFAAEFRCAADRDFLYFAVRVEDDTLTFGNIQFGSHAWEDAVEIQFYGETKPGTAKRIYISAESDGAVKIEGNYQFADRQIPLILPAIGVKASLKTRARGYDVEAAVPWSVLAWSGWEKGRLMGMNVVVYDWNSRDDNFNGPKQKAVWAANPDEKYSILAVENAPDAAEMKSLSRSPGAERIRLILDQMKNQKWTEALAEIASIGNSPLLAPLCAVVLQGSGKDMEESMRAFLEIARTTRQPSVSWWAIREVSLGAPVLENSGKNEKEEAFLDELAGLSMPSRLFFDVRLAQARSALMNGHFGKAKTLAEAILSDRNIANPEVRADIVPKTRELLASIGQALSEKK